MSHSFHNTILLVVFNYSNCVNNKDFIKRIYAPHFKTIIFYADLPATEDSEVNYVDITRGCYTQKIFKHFYQTYRTLINESDGLFYTMDDNIINVNLLHLYRSDKIIAYYNEVKPLDQYTGWQWDDPGWGKCTIYKLLEDPEFTPYGITQFSGTFSDWFYLPRRYLTDRLFDLFEIFGKHKVFLELAIPSVINNTETDKTQYQEFTEEVLWGGARDKFNSGEAVYSSLNHAHNLILHPIKFNQQPASISWLTEIFCKERCVIITTINPPTEAVLKHIQNPAYDVIIVGDKKTPDIYKNLKCIYLDVPAQDKLFPELSKLLPYNHYCRKNLGYLYAIKKGYKVIYETDDDNIPFDTFDAVLSTTTRHIIHQENSPWINIFKFYTNGAHIWPRGYPLSLLKTAPVYKIEETDAQPAIVNGLVENDPDVDALFRLICTHQDTIKWDTNKTILVSNKNMCVFNTQNTFWLHPGIFMSMLIPSTVSFRYCDILRGIIANVILKRTNLSMMYTSPTVRQDRNEHNLMSDFKSEVEMYLHNETILGTIEKGTETATNIKELFTAIYQNLLAAGIIKSADVECLTLWLTYF